jgi:hypothetical protein
MESKMNHMHFSCGEAIFDKPTLEFSTSYHWD